MATVQAERSAAEAEQAGLKANAIGFLDALVIGLASTAPAYSLAAVMGTLAVVVGVQAPAALLASFIPMFFIAAAFYYMNRADPDAGTTFSWVTRRHETPDLWGDLFLTWPEGQLWYTPKRGFLKPKLRVWNTGNTASPKSEVHYYATQLDDFSTGTSTFLRKLKIPPLLPGDSHVISPRFSRRKVPPDNGFYMVIDGAEQVGEANERNNLQGLVPAN